MKVQTSRNVVLYCLSQLAVYATQASTSALPYEIPGVVKLTHERGHGSGVIIGDNPLRIATALHVPKNIVDGGVQILVPSAKPGEAPRYLKSKKVYYSASPAFIEKVERRQKLVVEMKTKSEELDKIYKQLNGIARAPSSNIIDLLFGPSSPPEVTNEDPKVLQKKVNELRMQLSSIYRETNEIDRAILHKYADLDIAVLVFEGSLPDGKSLEQRVKDLEIIPIARAEADVDEETVFGGYGQTQNRRSMALGPYGFLPPPSPINSGGHLTTNKLKPGRKNKNVYKVYGYEDEDIDKFKLQRGVYGAPLPGDSGSGALTLKGLSAITSMVGKYESDQPPIPGWKDRYADDEAPETYNYLVGFFASTTSESSRELFARVEKETGPLVYADQVTGYESAFANLKKNLLATPKIEAPSFLNLDIQVFMNIIP